MSVWGFQYTQTSCGRGRHLVGQPLLEVMKRNPEMLGIHVFFVRVQKKALKWTSTIHICIFGSKLFIKASSLCFSGKNVLWNGKPPMCSASVDSNTTYELLECAAVKYLWVYGNWLGFNSRGVGHHQKDGRSTMRASCDETEMRLTNEKFQREASIRWQPDSLSSFVAMARDDWGAAIWHSNWGHITEGRTTARAWEAYRCFCHHVAGAARGDRND